VIGGREKNNRTRNVELKPGCSSVLTVEAFVVVTVAWAGWDPLVCDVDD
jgi:hypothetical protein